MREWPALGCAFVASVWLAPLDAAQAQPAASAAPTPAPSAPSLVPKAAAPMTIPPQPAHPPAGPSPHAPHLPPLNWDPAWARAGVVDYSMIVGATSVALAGLVAQPLPDHRRGGILFDDGVRDALRLSSLEARESMRLLSDVTLLMTVGWPFFVDGLLTAGWYRHSPATAYEMTVINAEALSIAAALQGVTNILASRERPYGAECGSTLGTPSSDCLSSMRFRSFYSGHATLAFTSASLVCWHHMQLRLLGEGPGDALSCVVSYTAATSVGLMRIAGDMHYATDVLVGAGMGTAVGLIVPAIHYARRARPTTPAAGAIDWKVVPTGAGLGVVGSF